VFSVYNYECFYKNSNKYVFIRFLEYKTHALQVPTLDLEWKVISVSVRNIFVYTSTSMIRKQNFVIIIQTSSITGIEHGTT
jgi:hypothetical protein